MASSRKDAKGYALHTGECQRRDGRYAYSYTDPEGTRRTVYAKTLAELRQKERKIIRDMEDGIDAHFPETVTLNQLYDKYIGQKYDLKPTTKANYMYMYEHFVRDSIVCSAELYQRRKVQKDISLSECLRTYTMDSTSSYLRCDTNLQVIT